MCCVTNPCAPLLLLVAESVPPVNDKPEPIVTAEIAVPLPCSKPVMLVVNVIAGVVVGLVTVPVKPFADTTETVVTVPELALMVAQVPSPLRYVVLDGVPVTIPTAVEELNKLLADAVAPAGKVTAVFAVAVNDCVNAPANVKLPAMVIVLEPLFTPVPP